MAMDEFDRFLASQNPDNEDKDNFVTAEHIETVVNAIDNLFRNLMPDVNQLVITLTRIQPDGDYVWAVTIRGTTIMVNTYENLIDVLSEML